MHILQNIPNNQLPVLRLNEVLGTGCEYYLHQLPPGLQHVPLGMETLQQLVPRHHVLQDGADLLKPEECDRKVNTWQVEPFTDRFLFLHCQLI